MVLYPITGPLRSPLLILEGIILLLGSEYGIYFLKKYYSATADKNPFIYSWGFFFLFFAGMTFFNLIANYFVEIDVRDFFLQLGYLSNGIGLLIFCKNIERNFYKKFPVLASIIGIDLGLLSMNLILGYDYSLIFFVISWIPFLILLLDYIRKLVKTAKEEKKWRVILFIIGIFIYLFSYPLLSEYAITNFGYISKIIGNLMIIISLTLVSFMMLHISQIEFRWKENLKSIYIIHESGDCLAFYNFQDGDNQLDDNENGQFIAEGIIGTTKMFKNIIESKDKEKLTEKIEVMDHKDTKLIFGYGKYITVILIADKFLNLYKYKIEKLIKYIENLYNDLLPKYGHDDIIQFEPLKRIIKSVFQ